MEYTEEQRATIRTPAYELNKKGVGKDTGINISVRLRKPGKAAQMIEWLQKNDPTVNEICAKSREIAREE